MQRARTFGRDPAVEVVVTRDAGIDFATVLEELGRQINTAIPEQTAVCTDTASVPSSGD